MEELLTIFDILQSKFFVEASNNKLESHYLMHGDLDTLGYRALGVRSKKSLTTCKRY